MNCLLDTHAFLWFVNDHYSLGATARDTIEDELCLVYLSAASIWEMAIKSSLGKLTVSDTLQHFVETHVARNDFGVLPIMPEHADQVAKLPFPETGHRDPFDRMIIAQAICHDLTIITRDNAFREYPVRCLW